jgi:hypothetical protein
LAGNLSERAKQRLPAELKTSASAIAKILKRKGLINRKISILDSPTGIRASYKLQELTRLPESVPAAARVAEQLLQTH